MAYAAVDDEFGGMLQRISVLKQKLERLFPAGFFCAHQLQDFLQYFFFAAACILMIGLGEYSVLAEAFKFPV